MRKLFTFSFVYVCLMNFSFIKESSAQTTIQFEPQKLEIRLTEGGTTQRQVAVANIGKQPITITSSDIGIAQFILVQKTHSRPGKNTTRNAQRTIPNEGEYPFSLIRYDDNELQQQEILSGEMQRKIVILPNETMLLTIEVSTVGITSQEYNASLQMNENGKNIASLPIQISKLTSVSLPFEDDVEGGTNGWTTTGFWHRIQNPQLYFVSPRITPRLVSLPDNGNLPQSHSGQYDWWYGQDSTGTFIGPGWNPNQAANSGGNGVAANQGGLISPMLDLSGQTNVTMKFWSWWEIEGVDVDQYDLMRVYVSTNGGSSYVLVDQLNPVNDVNGASFVPYSSGGLGQVGVWREQMLDLTSYVGFNQVVVKFDFNSVDNYYNGFRGWFIDDISVTAGQAPAPNITSVEPAVIYRLQQNGVEIYGEHFSIAAQVKFRHVSNGTIYTLTDATIATSLIEVHISSGQLPAGNYDVIVINKNGLSDTLYNGINVTNTLPPSISAVTPDSGLYNQLVNVSVSGENFVSGLTAKLGNVNLTNVVFVNANSFTATVPILGQTGKYTLTVENPDGQTVKKVNAYHSYSNTALVTGSVFIDYNGDGVKNDNMLLDNVTIRISGPVVDSVVTDELGGYLFDNLTPGSYTVTQDVPSGWVLTYPPNNSYTLNLLAGQIITNRDFGDFQKGSISGMKFNDANINGVKDVGEVGLQNWKIKITGPQNDSLFTDANGNYAFTGLLGGKYTVSEVQQNGWSQTKPSNPSTYSVSIYSGINSTARDFGNYQVGSISGMKFKDANANGTKDEGEIGLENWKIRLSGSRTDSAFTDGNGNYVFNVNAGSYTVSEEQQGGWLQMFPSQPGTYSFTLTQGEHATGKDFGNLPPGGSISGIIYTDVNGNGVRDANENPLSGWQVSISGPLSFNYTTTSNGLYSFTNLPAGTYTVSEVLQSGWAHTHPGGDGTYIINLQEMQVSENNDFANFQYGSISGAKYRDANANGVRDLNEQGIANWKIYIHGPKEDSTFTNAGGDFSFTGLLGGTYNLTEEQVAGWQQTSPNPTSSNIFSGTIVTGKFFGNYQLTSISGTVFLDDDGDGIKDVGEATLSGWKVRISGAKVDSVLSDENGNYLFSNLLGGNYTVSEDVQNGWYQTKPVSPSTYSVTLTSGNSVSGKDFGNFFKGSISGKVFLDMNGDGMYEEGESILSGWKIKLAGTKTDSTVTDENGEYSFSNLLAGNYSVSEVLQNGWTRTFPVSTSTFAITMTSGNTHTQKDFGNFEYGSISGTVFVDVNGNGMKDEGENGLQNWNVNLSGASSDQKSTDESGIYSFTNLFAGEYTVAEVVQNGWTQTLPSEPIFYTVDIFSGTFSTEKNFGNFELGIVSGTVWEDIDGDGTKDFDDVGIENWTVVLEQEGNPIDSSTTSEGGNFSIDGIFVGSYTITIRVKNGWEQTFPVVQQTYNVSIQSGSEINANNFGVVELGSIAGTKFNDLDTDSIKDDNETGVANWKIYLSQNDVVIDSMLTDNSGNYLFADLDAGTYTVSEEIQSGWVQTFPASSSYAIDLSFGQHLTGKNFGNYHRNTIVIRKYFDSDFDFITTEDRINVMWPFSVLLNGEVIASVTDTILTLTDLNPGTYTVTQKDSLYWTQLGKVIDGTHVVDSTELYHTTFIQDGKVLTVDFVDRYVPDTVKLRSIAATTELSAKATKLAIKTGKPYPLPTVANVRDTVAKRNSGIVVGISQTKGSVEAKTLSWIRWKTGGDISKFYTVIDLGKSYGFDSIRLPGKVDKKLAKEFKADRKKYINPLAQQLGVFKLNIAASEQVVFQSDPAIPPAKFGDLLYLQIGSPFNQMKLSSIALRVDSIMTYWNVFKDSNTTHHLLYDSITVMLKKLNSAFATPIDSIDIVYTTFKPALTLRGEVKLVDIPYLTRDRSEERTSTTIVRTRNIPEVFSLQQNYPNPFNPVTTIEFYLERTSIVSLNVYDILGREVSTLIHNEIMEEGLQDVDFDASSFASGVYFYRIDINNGEFTNVKKLMLMK
ncbi:MAG: T9SS type A sorting domain-containing protein [Ignavibacteria bacterium]|nr:T9SS type A sorting domain-containing protein [Ignavibacteria bacterium]